MRIGQKLIAGFLGVALTVAAVGAIGIWGLRTLSRTFTDIGKYVVADRYRLGRIDGFAKEMMESTTGYCLTGNSDEIDEYEEAKGELAKLLHAYREEADMSGGPSARLERVSADSIASVVARVDVVASGLIATHTAMLQDHEALDELEQELERWSDRGMSVSGEMHAIASALHKMHGSVAAYRLKGEGHHLQDYDRAKAKLSQLTLPEDIVDLTRKITAITDRMTDSNKQVAKGMQEFSALQAECKDVLREALAKEAEELRTVRGAAAAKTAFLVRTLLAASILAMVLAVLLGWAISHSITAPVARVRDAILAIARGELDRRVPVKSRDEIGQLTASFNEMARDLNRSIAREKKFAGQAALAEAEKKRAAELGKLNEELQEKTARLERFQDLTVGRELAMVHLKVEVDDLLAAQGKPKKYEFEEMVRKHKATLRRK